MGSILFIITAFFISGFFMGRLYERNQKIR